MVSIMSGRRTTIFGIGINDAQYKVNNKVNGKNVRCKFYDKWTDMMKRCYSENLHKSRHSYKGCSVTEEWHIFSNFKAWMEGQEWHGKELDKDILINGNKLYSPETCVFVDKETNSFTTDAAKIRGEYPIGVCLDKRSGMFKAFCCNPFTKKQEYLGAYSSPQLAHAAWLKRKHTIACQLAEAQKDQRVAIALRLRYNHG